MKILDSFIAVDTETTGLDFEHDRVIEIAAVRFEGGKPVADFEALLSPGERSLSPVSQLITGLGDGRLDGAPPAGETWRAFLAFVGDTPLVAHNAAFDAHFVRRALETEGLIPPPGAWLDSLLLSRVAWPTWDSHRLDSLAERLRVPRDAEHRALPDARRAGFVFLAAQQFLQENLSGAAQRDLARLASALPDWSLVWPTPAEEGARTPSTPPEESPENGNQTDSAEAVNNTYGVSGAVESGRDGAASSAAEEVGAAVSAALAGERWLVLETPVGMDENAAGLQSALRAARSGQRVMLAVPDNFAWNALRKSTAAQPTPGTARSSSVAALAEPSGYLCRVRLRALAENPERVPLEERAALLPLVAWADRAFQGAGGPVADGRGFSPERARLTWARVCCDAWNDDPAARAARDAAATSGVILVTHATLCAHVAAEGALLPACDSLIVTGAHRFPETAQSASEKGGTGRAITLFRLREALQLLRMSPEPAPEKDAGIWVDLVSRSSSMLSEADRTAWLDKWFEPERQLQTFLQKAGRQAAKMRAQGDYRVRYTEPVAAVFGADAEPVLEALRENVAFLGRAAASVDENLAVELKRTATRLRNFAADFGFLCEAQDASAVYWFEDPANPHKAALRAAPVDMDPFGNALRGLFGGGVFLGQALIAGPHARDARWFIRAAGLASPEPEVTAECISGNMNPPRFLMTPFAPAAGSGDQAEEFARFLAEAAAPFAARGVLVFCPSQTALRALHNALRRTLEQQQQNGAPEIRLWSQHIDGNRDAILRLYAAGRGGIVLAAEGIPGLRDVDGRAPALWAVTRMPLPPARDPILEARGEVLREEGGNARLELWHPAAVLRLKRDWAALHRDAGAPRHMEGQAEENRVGWNTVWLLDARAATEGLGARFAGALGCEAEIVRDVEELRGRTMRDA